jgi:hypothetical protein
MRGSCYIQFLDLFLKATSPHELILVAFLANNNPYFEVQTLPQLQTQTCHFEIDWNCLHVSAFLV